MKLVCFAGIAVILFALVPATSAAAQTATLTGSVVDSTGEALPSAVIRVDDSSLRATTGAELLSNLRALPGFGDQKAKIFTALLGKRVGVTPPGWEEAAGFYAERGCYSVADVDGPDSLARMMTN